MKFKSTKKALISSILVLAMCFSALVGTTFAWFTDSATSAGNVIKTGTLDIAFEKWNGDEWIDATKTPIFDYENWEPGYTEIVNLRVVNLGSLALKWQAAITTEKSLSALADVIYVYVRSDDREDTVKDYIDTVGRFEFDDEATAGNFKKFTLRQFVENLTVMTQGTLEPEQKSYLGIVLQMDPDAGNEYQNLSLGGKFDLTILATQYTYEKDSFDEKYDFDAQFPLFTFGSAAVVIGADTTELTFPLNNLEEGKQGSVKIPVGALATDDEGKVIPTEVSAAVKKVPTAENFTVAATQNVTTLDITVFGLAEDNNEYVEVVTYVAKGLTGVEIYHYDQKLIEDEFTYNPIDGKLTIKSKTFSPFNVVYNADEKYEAPETEGLTMPKATVEYYGDWVGKEIEWGKYDPWCPTPDVATPIDAAFVFTCPELSKEVYEAYKYWYCDFFVSLDRDLGMNQIFLGGEYSGLQVGFHNGDLELEKGTELPLLGTALSGGKSNWTYEMIVDFVKEFTCGVGDATGELQGATFTVKLRLTNPEDETESYDVNVVTHTFGGSSVIDGVTVVNTAEQLQDAFENGGEFVLGGDIDLNDLFGGN